MSPSRDTALVIGAGVFGLTSALELRRRDWRVTLLSPSPLPHPRASSTDVSKIVRMDYGSDDFFTGFAEAALAGWHAWNLRWSPPLYHEEGLLLLVTGAMREGGFEFESHRRLRDRGIPVERVDPLTLGTRFPAWNAELYPDGYFNPRAGRVESGEVVAALAQDAVRSGVRMQDGEAAELVTKGGRVEGAALRQGGVARADVTVVATGAWTPGLVPGLGGLVWPSGQPVLHFGVPDPAPWSPPAFPIWGADLAGSGWYGFPATPEGRVKVGHHGRGMRCDPRDDPEVPESHVIRCRAFLARALPELASAPLVSSRVCFYCDTWDGYFWIDRHPDLDGLVVAAGGCGHGFKFAPLLGPVVADAVEGRENRWGRAFRWRSRDGDTRTEHARYEGG